MSTDRPSSSVSSDIQPGVGASPGRSVSVVIITRNRVRELALALEALIAQSRRPQEVCVVDDSNPHLLDDLKRGHPEVIWVDGAPGHGRTNALRNLGVDATCGEIIAFLDDDSIAEPQWMETLVVQFDDPTVGGAGGCVLEEGARTTGGNATIGGYRLGLLPIGNFHLDPGMPIDVEHMRTCNLAVRRSVIQEVGGLDESYTGLCLRDDTDLCQSIRARGYRLLFDPRASVRHLAAAKADGLTRTSYSLRTQYEISKNHAYFLFKYRRGHAKDVWWYLVTDTAVQFFRTGRQCTKIVLLWAVAGLGKTIGVWRSIWRRRRWR